MLRKSQANNSQHYVKKIEVQAKRKWFSYKKTCILFTKDLKQLFFCLDVSKDDNKNFLLSLNR